MAQLTFRLLCMAGAVVARSGNASQYQLDQWLKRLRVKGQDPKTHPPDPGRINVSRPSFATAPSICRFATADEYPIRSPMVVKLRLRVAGSEVLATVSPREVPRPWTAAEDGSLKEVLRGLAQRGASNIMYTTVWQEATLQLASATGMPKRSVYAVQQRYLGLRKAQQLVYATVSVTAGRVALALKPRVGLPVLPQRRHTGAHLLRALRSELDASKRALSRAQTDMKELRANVERLRAENARLDADNVTLLAAQDGVSAAYITALVGAKKCRPGDDSQWQEEVTEEKKTDSPSKEAVAAEATEAEAETVEAAAKAEAAEAATEAAKAAAAEAAAEAAVEEEWEDGVEAEGAVQRLGGRRVKKHFVGSGAHFGTVEGQARHSK